MKITGDTQIVRTNQGQSAEHEDEWEISVAYNVEELYKGSEESDDPSHCVVNERVKVLEDIGPFRVGDLLVLTEDEQDSIEEDVLNEQL